MLKKLIIEDIPVVILAGGLGTRIADVKNRIPKALVKIGNYPIIYHIIKTLNAMVLKIYNLLRVQGKKLNNILIIIRIVKLLKI